MKHEHPIFDEFESFYNYLNDTTTRLVYPTFDASMEAFKEAFKLCEYTIPKMNFRDKQYPKLEIKETNPKRIIILFSGGKDSLATVLYYKKRGYDIMLYHLRGYNKVAPDEYKVVQKLAEYLELPLVIEEFDFVRISWQYDNPMIDRIAHIYALDWGIRNNFGVKIATGDFTTAQWEIAPNSAVLGGTDLFIDTENKILSKYIEGAEICRTNYNNHVAFKEFLHEPELLKLSMSCVHPQRFREKCRKQIKAKYDIDLLPNRCGYCWKCCVEYIYYTDHDVFEYNEDYYLHCLNGLKKAEERESLLESSNIQELWDNFIFYPMTKSKMFPRITKLKMRGKKVYV